MKLLRAENICCTVIGTTMVGNSMMKSIRLSSPAFIREYRPDDGEFLRCWFPLLDQPNKECMRGYTMIDIDYESGEFTVEFLLHEPAGPASAWARDAKVGDTFEASYYGSKPFEVPEPRPKGFIFVADAAGTPYVNALAKQLADDFPIEIWLLDWHESDHEIEIFSHENMHVEWIEPVDGALVARAKNFDWQGWYPHLVAESASILPLRRYLLNEVTIDKDYMYAHAYWIYGKSMGGSRGTRDKEPTKS